MRSLTQRDADAIVRLVEALHRSKLQRIRIEADGVLVDVTRSAAHDHEPGGWVIADAVGVFRAVTTSGGDAVSIGRQVAAGQIVGQIHTLDDTTPVRTSVAGRISQAHVG